MFSPFNNNQCLALSLLHRKRTLFFFLATTQRIKTYGYRKHESATFFHTNTYSWRRNKRRLATRFCVEGRAAVRASLCNHLLKHSREDGQGFPALDDVLSLCLGKGQFHLYRHFSFLSALPVKKQNKKKANISKKYIHFFRKLKFSLLENMLMFCQHHVILL